MFIEIGYFSICFALFLAIYSTVISGFSLYRRYDALIKSSRNAIIACFFCVFLSSLSMWHAIFYHDFSIKYVFAHTAVDMPPFYLFTSFWSALEGSHLLWTLLLSFVSATCIISVKKRNLISELPALCFAFSVCLTFMLLLNVTVSQPFERGIPANSTGLGMNALLQNPYMAIHPPMLFLGYSLLIVPFAYGFLALLKGDLYQDLLIMIRRFALIAWAILTVAIFLGGKWAYVVLGWGGYWAWDPVENASFMPWLAVTAFLHTLLICERTKKLPRLAIFLGMFGFILTFFGTFLTRSGVISSVHSFAESTIGPTYLLWIVFLSVSTLSLLFIRGHLLHKKQSFEPFRFSKESILFFTNYFLLLLLVIVFFGTIMPLIVEAISGKKISIQQPFYNAFAPWIGLVLVSILGIGNLAKWKSAKLKNPLFTLVLPLISSILVTGFFFITKHLTVFSTLVYFFILWTLFVLFMDFIYKLKDMRWQAGGFLKYHRSYFGALIIHIGFLIAVLGFSGAEQTLDKETTLPLENSVQFEGYTFTNRGLTFEQEYNEKKISAVVNVENNLTHESFVIKPARTKYSNNDQWFNEVGIESKLWFDLYLVLMSFDTKDQNISIKISYNPMVKFVWTSVIVMVFGAFIALTGRVRLKVINENHSSKFFSSMLIFFVISLSLFGLSGIVSAQEIKQQTTLEDVGRDLRCPTCIGISILESDTPQSIAMRTEAQKLVHQGKTKDEIVNYFKEHYGSWILREPDTSTFLGKLLWGIPLAGFIIGPFVLLWKLRRKS